MTVFYGLNKRKFVDQVDLMLNELTPVSSRQRRPFVALLFFGRLTKPFGCGFVDRSSPTSTPSFLSCFQFLYRKHGHLQQD
jgi:hypothetical protein